MATETARHSTYEWRPWTPPSSWADGVRRSNFNSPLYVMSLYKTQDSVTYPHYFTRSLYKT